MTEATRLNRLAIVAILLVSITFSPILVGTAAQAAELRTHHFTPTLLAQEGVWGIYMTAPNCGMLAAYNGLLSLIAPPPFQEHFGFLAGYYAGLLSIRNGPCVNG